MTSGNVSNSFRISSVGGMDGPAQLQLKEELFETPSDLVCPITHELFRDPVRFVKSWLQCKPGVATQIRLGQEHMSTTEAHILLTFRG